MPGFKANSPASILLVALVLSGSLGAARAGTLFSPYVAYPVGSWEEVVAIGDLNGDGRNDVAVATGYYFDPENDYMLHVFLQDESGGLAAPIKYATASEYNAPPETIAIGDINNDGLADVVIGHRGKAIEIFRQNAAGGLDTPTSILSIYSNRIRIGDLNNDGLADIAGVGNFTDQVGVYLQDANGGLQGLQTYYALYGGNGDLDLGDVNNDGLTDIVVLTGNGYGYNDLAVLTQNSAAGFDPVTYYDRGDLEMSESVAIGDVNGDGLNDVSVSYGGNRPASKIGIFYQDPSGSLSAVQSLPSYDIPRSLVARDLNNDNRVDLVVLHGGWYRMGVYLQQADGQMAAEDLYPIPYASNYQPQGLAIGDIDGNGSLDAAIADYNNGLVVLHNTTIIPQPPVVDAGADRVVDENAPVSLTATASDSDGSVVSYFWRQLAGPAVSLSGETTASAAFTAPSVDSAGAELIFEIQVTDDSGLSASDQVQVSVANVLVAPVADAGGDQTVLRRTTVTLDGSASFDPDGSVASYQWTQVSGPAVSLSNASSAIAGFVAPHFPRSTELVFRLTVTDDEGITDSDQATVTVVKRIRD